MQPASWAVSFAIEGCVSYLCGCLSVHLYMFLYVCMWLWLGSLLLCVSVCVSVGICLSNYVKCNRSDHITDTLVCLHWLHVPERVQYKIAVLVYKVLYGLAPQYLGPLNQRFSNWGPRTKGLQEDADLSLKMTCVYVYPTLRQELTVCAKRSKHIHHTNIACLPL